MKNIYAIKDNKMGFESIFIAPNNAAAIRMFGDTCRNDDTLFAQHPEDFELYKIGELNGDTGEIIPEVYFLEKALSFKNNK